MANELPDPSVAVPRDISGITAAQYRAAMRNYPAGVTIVTMASAAGPVGFTASSFASISQEPPLISFNIADCSSSIDALRVTESVVIHFLGEHQQHLAQRFARTAPERFSDQSLWATLESGEPILHGTPIWLRVVTQQLIPVGDHTLVVGLVARVHHQNSDEPPVAPLLYHDGRYYRPTPLD